MRKFLIRTLMAVVGIASVLAASLTVAAPAHAYENGSGLWQWVSFNTGNCNQVNGSGFGVGETEDHCVVNGVNYKKDSGGVGLMAQFIPNYCCGGTKAWRLEWHPNGERLKVCDLSNDGDGIYARLKYKSYDWYWEDRVSPPGSDATVECREANYSYVEGTEIRIYTYDDAAMSDSMISFYSLRG